MKLPLSSPIKPTITQLFGDKSRIAWYKTNGIDIEEHNGVDFTVGNPEMTYGTKLVCPFPSAGLSRTWFTDPCSTKGNGIEISYENYLARFWHCSEITVKSNYREGDVVGYIGNSGLCNPSPTDTRPFDGSHLHLMVFKDGILIDPLTIFDRNAWYVSPDTGVDKDLPPLNRVLKYMKDVLYSLLAKLNK